MENEFKNLCIERKQNINNIFSELNELRDRLRDYDMKTVKNYIKTNMTDDVENIIKAFHTDFDNVPDNDKLKIETLILLGELGIIIYK